MTTTTMTTLCRISETEVDDRFAEIIAAEWPKLEGRQTPDAATWVGGADLELGGKCCEFGRRTNQRIRPFPWQEWSLEQILAKNPDGTWTHSEVCLLVPRQNGKSLILTLRVLYGLFKLGENIVFSAHQWETAKSLWKRTWNVVRTTPWLLKRVESKTCSQGRGTIVLKSGAQVVFTTRSKDAGRGLDTVDLEIYDEAYDLTEADMAALSPTKMNSADPQTIYTSSAVNQVSHSNGAVLAGVRERGLDGEDGLFFAEWKAADGMDRGAPATWRYANPSFGVIATVKKMTAEYKKFSKTALARKNFDVEYLGIGDWPTELVELEHVFDMDAWDDMGNATPEVAGGPIALALDMSTCRQWVTIAAATQLTDGRIHLEVGYHAAPGRAVIDKIVDLVERWDPCAIVMNHSSPIKSILPDLRTAGENGIEPEITSSSQMAAACGGFYDDAVAGRLSHTGSVELRTAVEGVKKREMRGGAFGWDYLSPVVISPLQAATLARWGLLTFGVDAPPPPPSRDDAGADMFAAGSSTGFDVFAAAF